MSAHRFRRPPPLKVEVSPQTPLLAREVSGLVMVGSSFALLSPALASNPTVVAIAASLGVEGPAPQGALVPLWGEGRIRLPGALAAARPVPRWAAASVWADGAVYALGATVTLVVCAPFTERDCVEVRLWRSEREARKIAVSLCAGGLGSASLEGLEAGAWRAAVVGAEGAQESHLDFEVKARTDGLEARLRSWGLAPSSSSSIQCVAELTLAGAPIAGSVRVGLVDPEQGRRQNLGDFEVDPFGGIRFEVPREPGRPRSLRLEVPWLKEVVQLPLPAVDESTSVKLGTMTGGALEVGEAEGGGSTLGLRIRGAVATAPLQLEPHPAGGGVTIRATKRVRAVSASVIDPFSGRVETRALGALEGGQGEAIEVEGAAGFVVAAGFVEGGPEGPDVPWEGWGLWLADPPAEGLCLRWKRGAQDSGGNVVIEPGSRPSVVVDATALGGSPALLLVRWERSPGAGPVHRGAVEALGGAVCAAAGAMAQALTGHGLRSLFDACGAEEGLGRAIAALSGDPRAAAEVDPVAEPEAPSVFASFSPGRDDGLTTLMVRQLDVAGRVEVELPEMPPRGRVHIEAIAPAGPTWSRASLMGRVGPFATLKLWCPPFVDHGDAVSGRLVVETFSGVSRLSIELNGDPVLATLFTGAEGAGPLEIGPGEPLPDLAKLSFALSPGSWRVRVQGSTPSDIIEERFDVDAAGTRRPLLQRVAVMKSGQRPLVAAQLGAHGGLCVVRVLEGRLQGLVAAALTARWSTCESRAARTLAAIVGLLHADVGSARRLCDVARSQLRALSALFVPGEGFARDRPEGRVDPYLSGQAVRHVLRMEALVQSEARSLDDGLVAAVAEVARLGRRAAVVGQEALPPLAGELASADAADLFAALRPAEMAVAVATARARLKRKASQRDLESRSRKSDRDEVQRRCDLAYGARVLIKGGDPEDLPQARQALAEALGGSSRGCLGAQAGAYNTVDAVALILALHEAIGLGAAGTYDAEGDPSASPVARATSGEVWVGWWAPGLHDLTDPMASLPFKVSLRAHATSAPQVRFGLGESLVLRVDLGRPEHGAGAAAGDILEIHLPAALEPVEPEERWVAPCAGANVSHRRLRIAVEGADQVEIELRAVGLTGSIAAPRPEHLAVGLSNLYDAARARAMVGLDVTVLSRSDGVGSRLIKALGLS